MCFSDSTRYAEPALASLALDALIDRYLNHLRSERIAEPLSEAFTLAAVLSDLCDLAQVRPPAAIMNRLEGSHAPD
jgi:hypothetical protein